MTNAEILSLMRRVGDYQLMVQAEDQGFPKNDINYEWVRGAFYTGVPALYEATGDAKYLDAALDYGESRDWKLDKPDTRHADWQCVGQLYLELYLMKRDLRMIAAIRRNIDAQIKNPKPGRVDWWWCDALYMAPPVLARLAAATGDQSYLKFLNTMYWDAVDFLYNEKEQLFFRDKNYFDARTGNGHEVFWSRGNGWVLAGLARILKFLPPANFGRPRFENLFKDMSARIAPLQPPDGLWRTSLLDPEGFPTGETSGTASFTYAMAWGVNHGLLSRSVFEQTIERGWQGLARCVNDEGRLGFVQGVAAEPGDVDPNETREYAAGALLLAGNEILEMRK